MADIKIQCRLAHWKNKSNRYLVLPLFLLVLLISLVGCSRSVRNDAVKIASSGQATAEHMAAYYDSLAADTIDVWEMTAFRRGYLGLPSTSESTALQRAYSDRYLALMSRKRFAAVIAQTYGQFSKLASYDSSQDILASVKKLSAAATGLTGRPLIPPDQTTAPVSATNAVTALVSELQVASENRAVLRENKKLLDLLDRVKTFFDSELPVCQAIADDKHRVLTQAAKSLVEGGAVDSTALVDRVLSTFDLRWPSPTKPFNPNDPAQKPLVEGIVQVIEARANPLAVASKSAGEKVSDALSELISAHRSLVAGRPLSLTELLKENALLQDLLDMLRSKANIKTTASISEKS